MPLCCWGQSRTLSSQTHWLCFPPSSLEVELALGKFRNAFQGGILILHHCNQITERNSLVEEGEFFFFFLVETGLTVSKGSQFIVGERQGQSSYICGSGNPRQCHHGHVTADRTWGWV